MADDLGDGENIDERAIELSSISAIYPELAINSSDPYSASIDIQVEPVQALPVIFPNPSSDGAPPQDPHAEDNGLVRYASPGEKAQEIHYLVHLPPLHLRICLPDGYPSQKPPNFEVRTQHSWLLKPNIQKLRAAGVSIWEDMGRDQVVYAFIDYLRDEADNAFGLLRGSLPMEIPGELEVVLLDFDLKAKRAKFEHETFECGVCLEPKKGHACYRLVRCSHVFCQECLQDFYNACITEGDIGSVRCMAPKCEDEPHAPLAEFGERQKRRRRLDKTLEPSELLQIPLEQEIVQRYISLKRKKRLESDRSTVYCPRQWCQGPARCQKTRSAPEDSDADGESDSECSERPQYDTNTSPDKLPPPAERLSICEDCNFAFCKVCKASWHGEYYTCFPRSQVELTAEEKASQDYMKLHTQPCPTCDARAQKTHGCNHMICFKCDTHFCYLCGSYLENGNPYSHFNDKSKGCFMRLWELEGGDGGEIGQGFGGGADGIPLDWDSEGEEEDEEEDNEIPGPPAANPIRDHQQLDPALFDADNGFPVVGEPNQVGPGERAIVRNVLVHDNQRQLLANQPGLQRFLRMVQDDEEDEWDSDEMDEEAEGLAG